KGLTGLSNLLRSVHAEATRVHPLNLSKHARLKQELRVRRALKPKRSMTTRITNYLLSAVCSLGCVAQLSAQNTAFTYQGRLNSDGNPANGVYDFTFQAFDAPVAGNSIGGTVSVNAVDVTNGLFTALLDLGTSPFTGPARWLQIRVST